MMASSRKDAEAPVDLLLRKGADANETSERSHPVCINCLFHTDNNGQTALHFAVSKNNLDVTRQLLAHNASARSKDRRQQLPLHRAAAIGSVPIMKLLVQHKSPLNAQDADGSTALHHGEPWRFCWKCNGC